ncbi:competence/damage-inducible protein A [Hyphococcus sp. DH-69]|uniref:competence/damage-inducible protein A n=1 Tax=Hyphococcus formosus TaxID=3143534 RepID=UPI00398ABC35
MAKQKTAAILAIGDELLSGRTQDANMHYLAGWLTERGVELREARFVTDDMDDIGEALNALRTKYDYVFTSGGIGPTHDDITIDAIAKALGVSVITHPIAKKMIEKFYTAQGKEVTEARLRMARTPEGARLIVNKLSGAPGVCIENIFVMAGVPGIFRVMLTAIDDEIERGEVVHSRAATAYELPESVIAGALGEIQTEIKGVSIGSYPIDGDDKGVTVVARSRDAAIADKAIEAVATAIKAQGFEPVMSDRKESEK